MIISCKSFAPPSAPQRLFLNDDEIEVVRNSLKEYTGILRDLRTRDLLPLGKTSSPEVIKKILLLWQIHAHLIQFSRFLDRVRDRYFVPREALLDSRQFALRLYMLDEITGDAYLYGEFVTIASQLTKLVESLLNSITAAPDIDSYARFFNPMASDIRGMCTDLNEKVSEMSQGLEHHLKFLQLRRDMQQSNSTWMLSVLASIFLPLSLATSILSMQTRFADLHYLLYDFCGVVVVLLTLTGLILALVRLYMRHSNRLTSPERFGKVIKRTFFSASIFIIWALVLSSFLVGMSFDVGLGDRILGYGFASIIVAGAVFYAAGLRIFKWL